MKPHVTILPIWARTTTLQHDSYDRAGGNLVWCVARGRASAKYYSGATGENIAAGYGTPQSVMGGWMNSAGHRNNILSTGSWEIGVGYATVSGSGYTRYWTQEFGKRSGVYPLIIDRDTASTDSRKVTLYLYGTFQQMRLKNDSSAWGDWQTFQNNLAWTIANGVGSHTVTAELKTGSTVVTSSDAIYLNQTDGQNSAICRIADFHVRYPAGQDRPDNRDAHSGRYSPSQSI